MKKSYSKFTFDDLQALGLRVEILGLFTGEQVPNIVPSSFLIEQLGRNDGLSLNTEKAKSEFIIAPILNEVRHNNKNVFAVYSGFNFNVDVARGLQGFCDFLLAKLPLSLVPQTAIIAVVEAKLYQDLSAAVPQCAAEMYAARIWNKNKNDKNTIEIYGTVTTGDTWLFLRLRDDVVEVDETTYYSHQLGQLLGVWQHIINQFK